MRMMDLRNATEKLTWTDVSFTMSKVKLALTANFSSFVSEVSSMGFFVGWT